VANSDDEQSRSRPVTATNVWEAFDRFSSDMGARFDRFTSENREARHSSTGQITKVIALESKETRAVIDALESRVRALETSTPGSLGQRMGESEQWRAVISAANLPNRVDHIESILDQMRGSLNLTKYLQVIVSLAVGVITVIGFLLLQRPA
jgi:hypothetical protein